MKQFATIQLVFKLVILCVLLINYNAFGQKTTVWIVRHAEKEMSAVADPDLSATGYKRSLDLLKSLKHEKIAGIYVTNFKRTLETARPVAEKYTLVPELYNPNPAELKAFAVKVLQFYKGHTILIIGHSNTILPTVAAFGGGVPFTALTDDDYDMLFKLTINGPDVNLQISYYGQPHHTTEIPDQYLGYTKEHFIKPPTRF